MTIKHTVICDKCDDELTDIQEDDIDSEIDYHDWTVNPDNGWEHFCKDCKASEPNSNEQE